jgi:hypothetical protein
MSGATPLEVASTLSSDPGSARIRQIELLIFKTSISNRRKAVLDGKKWSGESSPARHLGSTNAKSELATAL